MLKVGPNAQAVVDRLKDRPAAVIAAQSRPVQATFRALFNGAFTPGRIDHRSLLECGHREANEGWSSGCWAILSELGLVKFGLKPIKGKTIMTNQRLDANSYLIWEITDKGWEVRMDDVAWMHEFIAAKVADEATKQ